MSSAGPDHADTVEKIGDLAASAGIRRVHVLAWRDLDDDEAGGSEVHIHEVARRWAAAGVEVTMRTSHATGRPAEATRDGYRVIRRAGRYAVFPRAAMAEALRRTGPRDVLVEIWNGMPFLSPVWCRGPRVIFLHHVHAEMWHMTLGQRLGQLGALLESKVAPPLYRRSAVATLSESSKVELIDDLGFDPERIAVVHPGIDPRFTPSGPKAAHPLVMAVGRLVPVKRYEMLVRAAHHARATIGDLRLEIVGEGYERPAVEALIAQLGAQDWVTLRGWISEEDKIDLYRRAWVVASASAREGWGMTLTEAAACGTPAVATRIAGHADAVQDGSSGLLADGDPAALGGALASVLGDPGERARLTRGALDWAAQLTWNNTATELMRVVSTEVNRRRSNR